MRRCTRCGHRYAGDRFSLDEDSKVCFGCTGLTLKAGDHVGAWILVRRLDGNDNMGRHSVVFECIHRIDGREAAIKLGFPSSPGESFASSASTRWLFEEAKVHLTPCTSLVPPPYSRAEVVLAGHRIQQIRREREEREKRDRDMLTLYNLCHAFPDYYRTSYNIGLQPAPHDQRSPRISNLAPRNETFQTQGTRVQGPRFSSTRPVFGRSNDRACGVWGGWFPLSWLYLGYREADCG